MSAGKISRFDPVRALAALLFLAAACLLANPAGAEVTVDCDNPGAEDFDTINTAAASDPEIRFKGTCDEDLDGLGFLDLNGDFDNTGTADGTINGEINHFFSALVLNDLIIAGSDAKNVFITETAELFANNVTFGNNINAPSVQVGENSHAEIRNSEFNAITSRDSEGPFCTAICVFDNSQLRMENTTVVGQESVPNVGAPVQAFSDSSIVLRGGNTITNNDSNAAVIVAFDSSIRQDDGNSNGIDTINSGIEVLFNSFADVRAANVNGDADNPAVLVQANSTFRAAGSGSFGASMVTIDGMGSDAVQASADSVVDIDGDNTVNGDVNCSDTSTLVNDSFTGGSPNVDCSAFYVGGSSGNVGVGTRDPDEAFHVFRESGSALALIKTDGDANSGEQAGFQFVNGAFGSPEAHTWDIRPGGVGNLIYNYNGGGVEFTYKTNGDLTLTGDVFTSSCSPCVSDYVFEPGYELMPLAELGSFIEQNGHLPNVPSEAELQEQGGVALHDLQVRVLEKVEELVLYTLEQDEAIQRKDRQIEALRTTKDAEIDALRSELADLRRKVESLAADNQVATAETTQ